MSCWHKQKHSTTAECEWHEAVKEYGEATRKFSNRVTAIVINVWKILLTLLKAQ